MRMDACLVERLDRELVEILDREELGADADADGCGGDRWLARWY